MMYNTPAEGGMSYKGMFKFGAKQGFGGLDLGSKRGFAMDRKPQQAGGRYGSYQQQKGIRKKQHKWASKHGRHRFRQ